MRYAVSAFLVLALALTPAQLKAQEGGDGTQGTIMGRFNCMPEVPCDLSDAFYTDPDKIFGIGNSCIGRNLSKYPPQEGFFEQSSGLDGNGCLTTSESVFPSTNGNRTAPHCCIITLSSGNCALHCNVVTE